MAVRSENRDELEAAIRTLLNGALNEGDPAPQIIKDVVNGFAAELLNVADDIAAIRQLLEHPPVVAEPSEYNDTPWRMCDACVDQREHAAPVHTPRPAGLAADIANGAYGQRPFGK